MYDRNFLYVMLGVAAITAALLLSLLLFQGGTDGVAVEKAPPPETLPGPTGEGPAAPPDRAPRSDRPAARVLTVTLAGTEDPRAPDRPAPPFHVVLFDPASGAAREWGPFAESPVEIPAPEAVYEVFVRARRDGATLFSPVLAVDLTVDDVRIGLMLRADGCRLSLRTENDEGFFGRIEILDARSIPLFALPSHEGRADLVLPEGLYRLRVLEREGGPPLVSEKVSLRDRAVSLKLVVDPGRPAVETLRERREDGR